MKPFLTILGVALAAVVGTGLSLLVLIGSQGMNDRTPVLPVIAAYVPMLAIAHGVGAALGLVPVRFVKGNRPWKFAVCGFAAGGAIEGLLFPLSMMSPNYGAMRVVAIGAYVTSLLLPATVGIAGLLLEARTADPARASPSER